MKIKIGLGIILSLVILTFIGCTRKEGPVEGKETIVFMARGGGGVEECFIEAANNFMREHPDIKVKVEVVPDSIYFQKVLTAIAGGSPPDVICMTDDRLLSFADKDALLELTSFLDKDKDVVLSSYYPVSLRMFEYKDKLYGLPYDIGFYLMFYNKDLFDADSLPYPVPDWTWDDYLELAKKLTKDIEGDGRIDQFGTSSSDILTIIVRNGGSYVDDLDNPKRCTLDSPVAIETIQFCVDLINKYHVCPTQAELKTQVSEEWFMTGRMAMSLDGHWRIPIYKNIKSFKWGVVPLPLPQSKEKFLPAGGGGFCISKGTKHPEASWKLIKYLTGPEGQKSLLKSGLTIPTLKSIAESPLFLKPPPDNKEVFLEPISYVTYNPRTPKWMEARDIIYQELEFSLLGLRSVPETCQVIVKKVNKLLAEGK